jgi:DNA-binding CsgD family transcriptional regulator
MSRLRTELPEAFALAAKGYTMAQIARELNVSYWAVNYWAQRNGVTLARYKHSLRPKAAQAIALAKDGHYPAEIARITGMSAGGVMLLLRREGVTPGKHTHTQPNKDRAAKIADMFRQGVTLERIGAQFGITRERVRQILKRDGLVGEHGGQAVAVAVKKPAKESAIKAARDARCFAKWGVSYTGMKSARADGTLKAYCSQRNSASIRGIEWAISFVQWLAVWQQSGKLHLRGRGKGRYVMSRINDDGGYRVGNVHIQLSTENNREGLKKCRSHKAASAGVWRLHPNSDRPWVARFSRTFIGRYATEAEAAAARAAYIEANGLTPPVLGRGYYVIRGKTERYQVHIGEKYIGTFPTPDAALAARAAACQQAAQPA